jgi:hypothetical protein
MAARQFPGIVVAASVARLALIPLFLLFKTRHLQVCERHTTSRQARSMNTNSPRYWFRAKRYGLGWGLPLAWQGWVFLLAWIVTVLVGHRLLLPADKVLRWTFTGAMLILLLVVCYWKGEPLGRRWNSGDDA